MLTRSLLDSSILQRFSFRLNLMCQKICKLSRSLIENGGRKIMCKIIRKLRSRRLSHPPGKLSGTSVGFFFKLSRVKSHVPRISSVSFAYTCRSNFIRVSISEAQEYNLISCLSDESVARSSSHSITRHATLPGSFS